MMKKISLLLSVAMLALPMTSFAHEGHGLFSGGEVIHYISSPLHIFPLICAIVVSIWFISKRTKAREPGQ